MKTYALDGIVAEADLEHLVHLARKRCGTGCNVLQTTTEEIADLDDQRSASIARLVLVPFPLLSLDARISVIPEAATL